MDQLFFFLFFVYSRIVYASSLKPLEVSTSFATVAWFTRKTKQNYYYTLRVVLEVFLTFDDLVFRLESDLKTLYKSETETVKWRPVNRGTAFLPSFLLAHIMPPLAPPHA